MTCHADTDESRGISLLFISLYVIRWVVNAMHRWLYHRGNSPFTHFIGGGVGLGKGFDGFRKLPPHRGSNPKPSTPIASPNTVTLSGHQQGTIGEEDEA
jgi:hypothetical protein